MDSPGPVDCHRGALVRLQRASTLREYLETKRREATSHPNANDSPMTLQMFYSFTVGASKQRFLALRRANFGHLRYEWRVEGGYVVVRVLEPGIVTRSWMSVVEDDQGNACLLEMFNHPPREPFFVGTVLIIKEPFATTAYDGYPTIRCDCPTDIIVLSRSHQLYGLAEAVEWKNQLAPIEEQHELVCNPPNAYSASAWKTLGGDLFLAGNMSLAMESYKLGLLACRDRTDPAWRLIQSQLCSVYYGLGYYDKTVATKDLIPDPQKALFSAGRALYQLRKYGESVAAFKMLHSNYEEDIEVLNELSLSMWRVLEQSDVDRYVERLIYERTTNPYKKLGFADYCGPIRIVFIPGKGRGIVLDEDVDAQTILIVSKAFVSSLDPMKPSTSETVNFELVSEIAQAITRNPKSFAQMIYELSTGAKRMAKVPPYCDLSTEEEFICDVERIKAIWRCNSFPIRYKVDGRMKDVGAGLFILPSYLNHSCDPNVHYEFYNDVMVVRSSAPLKAGDELCISYVPCFASYETRNRFLNRLGFNCECQSCIRSRWEGAL